MWILIPNMIYYRGMNGKHVVHQWPGYEGVRLLLAPARRHQLQQYPWAERPAIRMTVLSFLYFYLARLARNHILFRYKPLRSLCCTQAAISNLSCILTQRLPEASSIYSVSTQEGSNETLRIHYQPLVAVL